MSYSGLDMWLSRRSPLMGFEMPNRIPLQDTTCWVSINTSTCLHQAGEIRAQSLHEGWSDVQKYMEAALALLGADEPGWLSREDAWEIENELGVPPLVTNPMYFMSVKNQVEERLVYVGKTSLTRSRFSGGHAAITKLHDPRFNGFEKKLYLASLMFHDDFDYLPIEYIREIDRAEKLLSSIEAQIIYDLQPELNTSHRKSFGSHWPIQVMFENSVNGSTFLKGMSSYGPKGGGRSPPIWSAKEISRAARCANGMFLLTHK